MKVEDLGGIKLYCSGTHRFGTDAVLLENFANIKRFKSACDIGTGCGIIAMLLARDNTLANVTAVDIQEDAIALVDEAIKTNGLQDRVSSLCCDVKSLPKELCSKFDLCVCNPPYKRAGSGLVTENEGLNIARMELLCTFDDIAKAAADILMPNGRFCVCNRPDRLTDVICAMRKYGIEPKRLRMAAQKYGAEPMLFLCEGQKGAKSGLVVEKTLYLQNVDGDDTDEVTEIYKKWREHLRSEK